MDAITSSQWWAIGIGAAAVLVLFWDQLKGMWAKVPDILPDDPEEPDGSDEDVADLRAVGRLEARATRLESEKLGKAVDSVKASFFGG